MKQVQDMVERLWDFIEQLDISTLGKFLADNLVGSVVAFSLLFWVPLSILVHCMVGPFTGVSQSPQLWTHLSLLSFWTFSGSENGPTV